MNNRVTTLQEFVNEEFSGNNTLTAEYLTKHNTEGRQVKRQQVLRWIKQEALVINNSQIVTVKLTIDN